MIPVAQKHQLSNGMEVLTVEQESAQLVSLWLWYKVGARNELPGATGLSHWVEHMMFKGTPTFPTGTLDKLVNESGGRWNAFTTSDCTAYYTTLPVVGLETLLRIERDRMVNTTFTPASVESERTVIISERAGYENYPEYWLEEAVEATAYTLHPYRQSVLGSRTDLERITPAELLHHYQVYYNPTNALLVAVGGFETASLLELLERTLGSLPPREPADPVRPVEPLQSGERSVVIRRPGPTPYLRIVYHVPPANHPDRVVLMLIDAILSGGKGPSAWSPEKEMGRSSRLYRLLVDGGLATEVRTEAHPTIDPGLFTVDITARPDVDVTQVENLAIETVEGLATASLDAEELSRAVKQCKAQLAYASEGVENLALLIGTYAITSSPESLYNLADALDKCDIGVIQRVAATYLRRDNRTVGRFMPTDAEEGVDAEGADAEDTDAESTEIQVNDVKTETGVASDAAGGSDSPSVAAFEQQLQSARSAAGLAQRASLQLARPMPGPEQIVRTEIGPNMRCLACRTPGDIVTFLVSAPAGSAQEQPSEVGLAQLVNDVLLQGTQKRSSYELHAMADALGMAISVSCSDESAELEISCLAEDAPAAAELLAEIWLTPALDDNAIVQEKGRQLTRIREREDDTREVADRVWYELAYGDHPFAHPADGYLETVERVSSEQCRTFHRLHYLGTPLILCVTGAIEPDRGTGLLQAAWARAATYKRQPLPVLPAASLSPLTYKKIQLAGKSQSDITLGLPALARTASDFPAFYLGHLILGRLGLYGRLGATVREQLGLAYYVYAGIELRTVSSPWAVRAGVAPECVNQAVDAIYKEIRSILATPVRQTELSEAVGYLTGTLPTVLESSADLADTLLDLELYQLGLDYLQVYPTRIAAVRVEDIQAALARYINTDHFVQVVAGPK